MTKSRSRLASIGMFRALRHKNYSLFFIGQCVSLLGMWVQMSAMGWLVNRLTGSPRMLGLSAFCAQIPILLLGPIAGVLAERANRRKVLLVTQSLAMCGAFAFATLTLSGAVELLPTTTAIGVIFTINLFLGCVAAFDAPVRHTFVADIVTDRSDLGNAIALNSSVFNGARLIGPALGGRLIKMVGEGWCFLINGMSYIAVLTALFLVKLDPQKQSVHKESRGFFIEMKEGLGYMFRHAGIRGILCILPLFSIMGVPYITLLPTIVTHHLNGDSSVYGNMMMSVGIGALSAAITLAIRRSMYGLERIVIIAGTIFAISLFLFSPLTYSVWILRLLLIMIGFGMVLAISSCNTYLQTHVEDAMRGRVMSIFSIAVMGSMPFGSLIAGEVSYRIGIPRTLHANAIVLIFGVLIYAIHWKIFYVPSIRKPPDSQS